MTSSYDFFDYINYWKGRSYEDNCERIALEKFFRKIKKRNSLIDIGGGFGRLSTSYVCLFDDCLVIDPSEKQLENGRCIFKNFSNLVFKKDSLPNLTIPDKSFEVALLIRVLHHIKDPTPSFKEINRILKNDGYFILEFANKIHFVSKFYSFFKGKRKSLRDLEPVDRSSKKYIEENKIVFVNHHPQKILSDLEICGFLVTDILSVSNLRCKSLKKIVPKMILLFFENILQESLSSLCFGPSIFILARKVDNII